MKKIIFYLSIISAVIFLNNVNAENYIYTEEKIEEESSISTISANP